MARERRDTYETAGGTSGNRTDAHPRTPAADAVAALDAALAQLAVVDWQREDNAAVRAAAVGLQRRVNQLTAQALRSVAQVQARQAYQHDGAVTAASWLRNRANLDPAVASRLCTAARRVGRLPLLRDAFDAGDITLNHVTAVTEAAVPTRFDAISSVEPALVTLACTRNPQAVRTALRAVRDVSDAGGTDELPQPPVPEGSDEDPRRFWRHHLTIDGLWDGEYLVGGILGEMIATIFDAFGTPDHAELPPTSRRSPSQQRVDAMRAAITALLNAGMAPTIQQARAHLLVMIDLLTLLGREEAATFITELRRTGQVSPAQRLALGSTQKLPPS